MTGQTVYEKSAGVPGGKRGLFAATVEAHRPLCREHYLLRLRVAGDFPATRPGQFIQLGCRPPAGSGGFAEGGLLVGAEYEVTTTAMPHLHQAEVCGPLALLRRPFSLAGRGDDAQGTWLEIVYRTVGVGTQWLATLATGAQVDLIGPLGNAFTLPPGKSLGLLVGGGVGLPPMFYLAQALHQARWRAIGFVGAMSRDLLAVDWAAQPEAQGQPQVAQFAQYGYRSVITTNDGSLGTQGFITAGLEQVLAALSPPEAAQAVVFTCGPHAMMHAAARLAQHHGIACQVCLEQAMACGMGTCQSCVVKIDPARTGRPAQGTTAEGKPWRFQLACTDGPVFDAAQVVW